MYLPALPGRKGGDGMTGTVEQASDTAPLDIATMREAANRLLDPDAVPEALPPCAEELDTLTLQLRGHLNLLMPEVEAAALRLPKNSVPQYCAFACLGEARERLRAEPDAGPVGAVMYARRLARVLNALCDHLESATQAAYERLLAHSAGCKACRTVDEAGKPANDCESAKRLYENYRHARRAT